MFVENTIKHIFIYDIDIEDNDFVGEIARRSIEKYENSINLLRYTTTFAMLMISTNFSNDSAVLAVILLLSVT